MRRTITKKSILTLALTAGMLIGMLPANVHASEKISDIDYILGRPMTEEEEAEQESYVPVFLPEEPRVPEFEDHVSMKLRGSVYPEKYDSRDYGIVPDVRNQGDFGTCWAFAALGSMETNMVSMGVADRDDINLSETHLAYYSNHTGTDEFGLTDDDYVEYSDSSTKYNDGLDYLRDGGNVFMSANTLMKWKGAANEADWPYYPYSTTDMIAVDNALAADTDNAWNRDAYRLTNAYLISKPSESDIKELVTKYGSVATSFYWGTTYYKASTAAYYCPQSNNTNHAVVIVGWDDNYSASNFRTAPAGNGAWIVRNSWDSNWGKDGYFYISYYDTTVNTNSVAAFLGEEKSPEDNIYYYGGTVNPYSYLTCSGIAQVCRAQGVKSGQERLSSVGFFSFSADIDYTVSVYLNPDTDGNGVVTNPRSGIEMLTEPVTGKTGYAGYISIDIDEDIILNEGDVFSVVVMFAEGERIGIDYSVNNDNIKNVNVTAAGQSFAVDAKGAYDMNNASASIRMNVQTKDLVQTHPLDNPTENVYKIEYVLNGGTNNELNPDTYTAGEEIQLYNATRQGYVFNRWCTDSSLNYNYRITRITPEMTGDIVLYAKWVYAKYSIQFDGNAGDVVNTMSPMTGCQYNKTYVLNANVFERKGFLFDGWNTAADGSGTAYGDGAAVRDLSLVDGEVVTLYAQWVPDGTLPDPEENVYRITYVLNGGTNSELNPDTYTAGEEIQLHNAIRLGYAFNRWCTDSSLNYKYRITEITSDMTGDITLYAKWVYAKYSVQFDGNSDDVVNTMSLMTGCQYNKSYVLNANVFERKGFLFDGWNTAADGSGTAYGDGAAVRNLSLIDGEVVTLYAQWVPDPEENVYKITYVLNGGTNSELNPDTYTAGEEIQLHNATRQGFVFNRWCTDSSLNYNYRITEITPDMTGDIVLYAKWVYAKYAIRFEGNGADNEDDKNVMPDMVNCKYSASYVLTKNTYIREGYTFIGWNTKNDGTGITYKDEAAVKNLSSEDGTVVKLYAQWKED